MTESSRSPLRQERLTWKDVDQLVDVLVPQLRAAGSFDAMVLITRGGVIPGGLLCEALSVVNVLTAAVDFPSHLATRDEQDKLLAFPSFLQFPSDSLLEGRRVLIVDDVWGSGRTSSAVKSRCETAGAASFTCVLHFNPYRSLFSRAEPNFYGAVTDAYIVYPWEIDRGMDGVRAFGTGPLPPAGGQDG